MKLREVFELVVIMFIIIIIGSVSYSFIEGWKLLDSLYFSVITVTTLGYGDIVPLTDAGKIFTIFYSLSGIGIVFYFLAIIGKYIAFEIRKRDLRIINITRDEELDILKFKINDLIRWHPNKKDCIEGNIIGLGLDELKIKTIKKNSKLLSKKEQKTITITTRGHLKRE